MSEFQPISGHCQCGAVRYSVHAPAVDLYHCHCSICRRCHGTVFTTYATVPAETLVIEQGADNLTTYDSSAIVHRHFCRTCGCQLFIDVDEKPELRWYTPATADGHPGHTAEPHIFVGSKLHWYEIADDLTQLEGFLNGT